MPAACQSAQEWQEGKVCFQFQGAEWYVVGYIMAKKILRQFRHRIPSGKILSLAHGTSDSKIDDGERKPHVGHVMTAVEIPRVWPTDLARTCESCQHFRTRTSEHESIARVSTMRATGAASLMSQPCPELCVAAGMTTCRMARRSSVGGLCRCCTKPKQLFAAVHARLPCPKCRSEASRQPQSGRRGLHRLHEVRPY